MCVAPSLVRFCPEILFCKTKNVHRVYLVHHVLHDRVGDKHLVCREAESVTQTYFNRMQHYIKIASLSQINLQDDDLRCA